MSNVYNIVCNFLISIFYTCHNSHNFDKLEFIESATMLRNFISIAYECIHDCHKIEYGRKLYIFDVHKTWAWIMLKYYKYLPYSWKITKLIQRKKIRCLKCEIWHIFLSSWGNIDLHRDLWTKDVNNPFAV